MAKAPITHAALVKRAAAWLRGTVKCGFVLTEMASVYISEEPDAIGWKGLISYLIECKVSRADFFADRKKRCERMGRRMGAHRFYFTPPGLLRPEEVPEPWGLLELHGNRVLQVVRPLADNRPRIETPARDVEAELALVLAAAQLTSERAWRNLQEAAVAAADQQKGSGA